MHLGIIKRERAMRSPARLYFFQLSSKRIYICIVSRDGPLLLALVAHGVLAFGSAVSISNGAVSATINEAEELLSFSSNSTSRNKCRKPFPKGIASRTGYELLVHR